MLFILFYACLVNKRLSIEMTDLYFYESDAEAMLNVVSNWNFIEGNSQ